MNTNAVLEEQSSTTTLPDPYVELERIRKSFLDGTRFISVASYMKLTKTQKALCEVLLLNDQDLRTDVLNWLQSRTTEDTILSRYRNFDPKLLDTKLPTHFPARVVSGLGSISSGQNIFLFFPECLGVKARKLDDYFGIELIDVWANIFHGAVFPCARRFFAPDTQVKTLTALGSNLEKSIYLASIFHEVGHRVGAWRVSPFPDPRLKVSQFILDVFGEMATDSLLVSNLPEFKEIAVFVLLQRLFWFGRRGFRDNPVSARLNSDNDSWLSAFLWNRLTTKRALSMEAGGKWNLNYVRLVACLREISEDIEKIGQAVLQEQTQESQDKLALDWMKQEVEWTETDGFLLPPSQRQAYCLCVSIEEIPHFDPLTESTLTIVEKESMCHE